MRVSIGIPCLLVALVGCATTTAPTAAPPMAEDLVGWTAPTPVAEETPTALLDTSGEAMPRPNERVYEFHDSQEYKVDVPMGWPADIILGPGEVLLNMVGGDRAPMQGQEGSPWEVKEGESGSGARARHHLFVSCSQPGKTLGMIVTTNKRTYYLTVKAVGKTPIRITRWTYPDDQPVKPVVKASLLPDATTPARYHGGYAIKPSQPRPVWTPRSSHDDGRKTYIIFPPTILAGEAPMLRLIGSSGQAELVNSRMVQNVLILDRVINVAELRIGTGAAAETVTITRGTPITMTCPGEDGCPVWPERYAQEGRP